MQIGCCALSISRWSTEILNNQSQTFQIFGLRKEKIKNYVPFSFNSNVCLWDTLLPPPSSLIHGKNEYYPYNTQSVDF